MQQIVDLCHLYFYRPNSTFSATSCQGGIMLFIHSATLVTLFSCSLASHTLHREKGSGHTATIELSSRQKLDVTNQIRTLCRSHPLSWSTITSRVQWMSASYYLTTMFNNSVPWRQLGSDSVTRPFLSMRRVWLARLLQLMVDEMLSLQSIYFLDKLCV